MGMGAAGVSVHLSCWSVEPERWQLHGSGLNGANTDIHQLPSSHSHTDWLQAVSSAVLCAEKGLLFLDLSQKHFKLLQCFCLRRNRGIQRFSSANANSFLITYSDISHSETPGPGFALQSTYAITFQTYLHLMCTQTCLLCFHTCNTVSLSLVYKVCNFTGACVCFLHVCFLHA